MFEIFSNKSQRLKEHWTTPQTRKSNKTLVKLATDIFTFNNENYLLIVDYMSRFPVIRHLSNMTAKMVAEHMKAIFSELGVPKTLVSDNGPCYIGDQFKKTMSYLGIMHITTSPHHHQSSGLAEGYVNVMTDIITFNSQSQGDKLNARLTV